MLVLWNDSYPAHSDAACEQYILDCWNANTDVLCSTCFLLDTTRLLHAEKKIQLDYILIEETDTIINLDEDAKLDVWPDQIDRLTVLLGNLLMNRRKK